MEVIKFYRTEDDFGCFSNFASYPIKLDGKVWPTSEHFFQAQKFIETAPAHAEAIRRDKNPMNAARMGRDRTKKLRKNWENAKDGIMRRVVLEKFKQHPEIAEILLGTGDAKLIEHTQNDNYWADGGDGSGKNMLGIILMEVRAELRRQS